MHHPLLPAAMEALVAELFAAEQPYACPHGRPIVLQMTRRRPRAAVRPAVEPPRATSCPACPWRRVPRPRFEKRLGYRFADRSCWSARSPTAPAPTSRGAGSTTSAWSSWATRCSAWSPPSGSSSSIPSCPRASCRSSRRIWSASRVLGAGARALGLGEELRLGVGEERSGGRGKRSLLADSLEALFGAVYLDGGLEAGARGDPARMLEGGQRPTSAAPSGDAKTALQELAQAPGLGPARVPPGRRAGPDHRQALHRRVLAVRRAGRPAARARARRSRSSAPRRTRWPGSRRRRPRQSAGAGYRRRGRRLGL